MQQLPLDTVLRSQPGHEPGADPLAGPPVAVCEHRLVGWCNHAAEEAGIRAGMSESNARALAGALQSFPRDERREARALREAALWCLRFTPHVVLRASGILLEVAPSLRLFRGIANLSAQLQSGLAELGLHARMASAPTATGAWLRAQCDAPAGWRHGQPAAQWLDALPVHVLEQARPHLETLSGIGCATVGQLRRLPRKGVTRRFGDALLRELDRACGDEAEVHAWFEAPAAFDAQLELPTRIDHAEALLFAARRLLLQLAGWLTARHAAAAAITLFLHHEPTRRRDRRSTALRLALGMPSRDPEHMTLLLREQLARLELAAPVIELSLQAEQIIEQAAPNTELFPTPATDAASIGRLVERLQSRLGADAVRQLSLFADHRPELGMRSTPYRANAPHPQPAMQQEGGSHGARVRPVWLLKQPLPLATRRHKPCHHGPLTLLAGPERIESGWWDDAPATRDYFIAMNAQHMLLWIFRLRAAGDTAGSGWFLHGHFG